jgi:hypothetical protein
LFTSGRARLLDNTKLVSQFANLERRTTSARDKIDHPSGQGQHDDLSNAAAGALVLAAQKPGYDSTFSWVSDPDPDETTETTEPRVLTRPLYLHPAFRGF